MNLQDLLKKLTSGEIPSCVLAATGVILLLLTFKAGKAVLKLFLLLIALALIGGAAWWHFHPH